LQEVGEIWRVCPANIPNTSQVSVFNQQCPDNIIRASRGKRDQNQRLTMIGPDIGFFIAAAKRAGAPAASIAAAGLIRVNALGVEDCNPNDISSSHHRLRHKQSDYKTL
jgi:hypothetical protein